MMYQIAVIRNNDRLFRTEQIEDFWSVETALTELMQRFPKEEGHLIILLEIRTVTSTIDPEEWLKQQKG